VSQSEPNWHTFSPFSRIQAHKSARLCRISAHDATLIGMLDHSLHSLSTFGIGTGVMSCLEVTSLLDTPRYLSRKR